jgi:5-methylcytosine-specific restriction endonuclease McrA
MHPGGSLTQNGLFEQAALDAKIGSKPYEIVALYDPFRGEIGSVETRQGCWVICRAKDNLHFDHDLPYSKGGTSRPATNIRLLCARHNLAKSDRIE